MFISKKDRYLKRDIIDLLENETQAVTMKEIVERLGYPSLHAVKATIHLLEENIQQLYPAEKLNLAVSTRNGVRLQRRNTHLHKLNEQINSQFVSYHLIFQILAQREIFVDDYCEENYISRSTLARYVKKINTTLADFASKDIKITISNVLKITGQESSLRIFYFLLLKSTYEKLNFEEGWPEFLGLTEKIFTYLDLPFIQTQVEHIAIWVYVCQNAIDQHFCLSETDTFFDDIGYYRFVEKPDFLADWQTADWQLFLLFFYAMGYMPLDGTVELLDHSRFSATIESWFASFQKFFFPVTDEKRVEFTAIMQRQIQYSRMLKLKDNIGKAIETIQEEALIKRHPVYYHVFKAFWQDFVSYLPDQATAIGLRAPSFCNCIALVPLSHFMPRILIYVITEMTDMHNQAIKGLIRDYCANYNIAFVNDYRRADLIISSISFIDPLEEDQQQLTIRTSLPRNDLQVIYDIVQELTLQKGQHGMLAEFQASDIC